MLTLPTDLSPKQLDEADRAALLIIRAHEQAAEILAKANIPIGALHSGCGDFFATAGGVPHPCGCIGYMGDGGPCIRRVVDLTLPGGDGPPPTRKCGHRPSRHFIDP
jgi:Family of unknown function (DUF6422)